MPPLPKVILYNDLNEKPVCLCPLHVHGISQCISYIYITVPCIVVHMSNSPYVSCTGERTMFNLLLNILISGESYMYSRSIKLNWIITNTNTHIYPCVSQYIRHLKPNSKIHGYLKIIIISQWKKSCILSLPGMVTF